MKRILVLTFGLLFVSGIGVTDADAQEREREVEAAVVRLFDAMRAADGETAAALFHPDARLQSVSERNGGFVLSSSPASAFVEAIGTPRGEVWDERISDLEVRVDGGLATAWMKYAFHLDGEFSHCGVNAFQLVRADSGWQIIQVTDTRRQDRCD